MFRYIVVQLSGLSLGVPFLLFAEREAAARARHICPILRFLDHSITHSLSRRLHFLLTALFNQDCDPMIDAFGISQPTEFIISMESDN